MRCIDQTVYVGCTSDLNARLIRHRRGEVKYTSSRMPIEVETFVTFTDKYKAFEFELYLKSGSGRAFMKKHLLNN